MQRACREVEQKQPEEVAILAAVLQTKNSLVRREMYERELSRAAPALHGDLCPVPRTGAALPACALSIRNVERTPGDRLKGCPAHVQARGTLPLDLSPLPPEF